MWYVLQVAPRHESQVGRFLARHAIEAYSPAFPPASRTKPGSVRDRKARWLFPDYVFFRPADGFIDWRLLRWAPGVRRLLEQDGSPASVANEVVEHIRRRLADPATGHRRLELRAGQPVVIANGPLQAVDAIFVRRLNASERVQLLVTILGRRVTVEVDVRRLRPAG